MQIKMLASLLELYKTKNISKTSEKLFISQQGLSRQIKALEKELGVSLFIRKKDGVVPTEICHQLMPSFQSIYKSYTEALNLIDKTQPHRLRIGFASGISHGLSNKFLVSYQSANPDLNLEIQEWTSGICQEKLLSGELDLAVLIEPFDKSSLNYQLICQDDMYAAMYFTHPFAASSEPLPFEYLDGQQIITGSPDNALRQFFDYCCQFAKIQPQILMSSSYNVDFVNSMSDNTGVSTLTSAMAFCIHNPNVRIRKLILPISGDTYICWGKHNQKEQLIKQFTAFCMEYFQQNPIPHYVNKGNTLL